MEISICTWCEVNGDGGDTKSITSRQRQLTFESLILINVPSHVNKWPCIMFCIYEARSLFVSLDLSRFICMYTCFLMGAPIWYLYVSIAKCAYCICLTIRENATNMKIEMLNISTIEQGWRRKKYTNTDKWRDIIGLCMSLGRSNPTWKSRKKN